jgi:hypothetical protein
VKTLAPLYTALSATLAVEGLTKLGTRFPEAVGRTLLLMRRPFRVCFCASVMLMVTLAPFVRLDGPPPPPDGNEPAECPPPEHPAINIKLAADNAERRALFANLFFLGG